MSSILKALKRLEHENTARKPDTFRINAEILKGTAARRTSSVGVLLAAGAVFACGSFATYLYLKRSLPPVPVIAISPAPKTETRPEAPGVTVTPSDPSVIIPADQNHNMAQPKVVAPVLVKSVPALLSQPVVQRHQTPPEKPVETILHSAKPSVDSKPVSSPVNPVTPPVKPAALKLDGIAFQDGGVDSLAVINGTSVSKGSMIEGAKVEEVLKDRVRFSRGVDTFEIILDKSN
jgi:general secretion pathway protein B